MARTLLLADDSVTIQKVVELTFLDEDFRVVCYGNGADAVAALSELQPDVVLADVHMPGADGYEVCSAAQRARPGVPVLLLVGTFEVFDPQRAEEVGARGHLKKPFDSQELLRQVQELAEAGGVEPEVDAPLAETLPPEPPTEAETGAEEEPGAQPASWSFESAVDPAAEEEAADEPVAPTAAEPQAEIPSAVTSAERMAPEVVSSTGGEPAFAVPAAPSEPARELTDEDVDRIARRVVELIGERAVRDVAWEVVPDLAELVLKARIRELEASVE